jgi:hypothetical protein
MVRVISALKIGAANVALFCVLLLAVDVGGYFLLPKQFDPPGYRTGPFAYRTAVGGLMYPRYYFEFNASRGFDIKPAPEGVEVSNDFLFPIEANEFGCRDQKVSPDPTKPFIYVAGDSGTWGIVPIAMRWTERLERLSGTPVLNCGVPGTAQRHQHDKYTEVLRSLKLSPELVLVAYVSNDVWEDHRFPAYTVFDGFLILNDADPKALKARVEEGIERLDHPHFIDRIRSFLKNYSLSADIVERLWSLVNSNLAGSPTNTIYNYSDSEALENKAAIKDFARDVCSRGERFAVIVLPDSPHLAFPDYFQGLDEFLNASGISSVDLHRMFSNQGLKYSDLSQINDPHYSVIGNRRIADALYKLMQKNATEFGSCEHLAQ